MKKDVNIRIKGIYTIDADQTTAELFTVGSMYKKDTHYYVTYDESEITGFKGCTTTLKIESPDRVTLSRRGNSNAHLVLQRGMRNVGRYDMMGNFMEIGVYTGGMDCTFGDEGGDLHLRYTLDMNSSLMSENELEISVCEA